MEKEKKLNLAIIGQGRSGKDIHGEYYLSKDNTYFNVKYVVEADERRRKISAQRYAGCKTFADYRELFAVNDIDAVVNAAYSDEHFCITRDLLEHGLSVLVEKPFARNRWECETLIRTAKAHGAVLAVFQNTFFAPFYTHALRLLREGVFGKVEQIDIRYNNFARRWDWQTLQKKMGGSAYNTGPHPIGIGLGLLEFDPQTRVEFCKAAHTSLSSGDAEDYVKILLSAPHKPLVDIEINSTDAFCDYTLKMQGERGTFQSTPHSFRYKYITSEENPAHAVQEEFLQDENGLPIYCRENLVWQEKEGKYDGDAFGVGTAKVYENLYRAITAGEPLIYPPERIEQIIGVIEQLHASNPLPRLY